eukprot:gene12142-14206_t
MRTVSSIWRRLAHAAVGKMTIHFTDVHLTSSAAATGELFARSLVAMDSLHSLRFVSTAMSSFGTPLQSLYGVVQPVIAEVTRSSRITSLLIKGFSLDLKNCSLDLHSLHLLCVALSNNMTLRQLSIREPIGGEGIALLGQLFIRGSLTNLESITLTKNVSGDQELSFALRDLFQHIASCPDLFQLRRLDISSNGIGDEGLLSVSQGICTYGQLTHINLSTNQLSNLGNTNYGQHLTHLLLGHNRINHIGCQGLANLITHSTTLLHLDLCHNILESTGADILSSALQTNQSLLHLDLSFNRLGSEGATSIATAIAHNNIQSLHLQSNQIDKASAKSLRLLLTKTQPLLHLNLANNRLGITGFKDLTKIDLSHNKIQADKGLKHLKNYQDVEKDSYSLVLFRL